jgi:hypothetical protein
MSYLVLTRSETRYYGYDDMQTSFDEDIFETPEEVQDFLDKMKLYHRGKKIISKGPNKGKEADMTYDEKRKKAYSYDRDLVSIYEIVEEVSSKFSF